MINDTAVAGFVIDQPVKVTKNYIQQVYKDDKNIQNFLNILMDSSFNEKGEEDDNIYVVKLYSPPQHLAKTSRVRKALTIRVVFQKDSEFTLCKSKKICKMDSICKGDFIYAKGPVQFPLEAKFEGKFVPICFAQTLKIKFKESGYAEKPRKVFAKEP